MVFTTPTKRRKWFFCSAGIAAVLVLGAVTASFVLRVAYPARASIVSDLAYYQNVTSPDKVIALTFDDGPHPEKTRQVLAVLEKYQVPAAFFFLGSNVLHYPDVVREVHEAGYEIGNHTFSHSYGVHNSSARLALELSVSNEILKNITGEDTVLYRPPFLLNIGTDVTTDLRTPNPVQDWVAQSGYVFVGADIDSLDWLARSPEEVAERVLANAAGGHIVLLHDGGQGVHTVEALEILIPALLEQGYRFETVSEVLGLNAFPTMHLTQALALGTTDATTGGEVSALQKFLLMEGYLSRAVTGVFDIETQQALALWQQTNGIPGEAGVVGALTRERIAALAEARTPSVQGGLPLSFIPIGAAVLFTVWAIGAGLFKTAILALGLVFARFLFILGLWALHLWQIRHGVRALAPWRRSASVVIPVYNEEENLAATIESILRNSYPVGDILVVDDGSTDGSAAVARSYVRRYPQRVRLLEQQNGGKASALTYGIREAYGEIIVAIDADTVLEREAVGLLLRHFNDPWVAAVAGRVCVTPLPGLLNLFQRMEYTIGQQVDKRLFATLGAVGVVPGPIGAWRRSALVEVGGYSKDTLVEDQDITFAMLAAGKTVRYEPHALAYTEPPHTISDFLLQRLRWTYGTLQCLWKYKNHLGNVRRPSLGLVVLPNTLVFGVLMTFLYPLADLLFLGALAFGAWQGALVLYVCFIIADTAYAALGLAGEKNRLRLLAVLPLQRLFYRFVMYVAVISSLAYAVEGAGLLWGKVRKRGEASAYHAQFGQTLAYTAQPPREEKNILYTRQHGPNEGGFSGGRRAAGHVPA